MKDEERKPDEAEAETKPQAETEDEAAARAKRVVFKIVPANPKNAFNFEDVADK